MNYYIRKNRAIFRKHFWSQQVQYSWWKHALEESYGSVFNYLRMKEVLLPDQRVEFSQDAIGTYCMGGEL